MILRILFSVIFLAAAFITPLYFDSLLSGIVETTGLGWVFSTILIRLLVIIFLAISLRLIFSMFAKTKTLKVWLIFLIALLPGFGISFISPIYITDYGMLTDDMKLENIEVLEIEIGGKLILEDSYNLVAFFTTSCPHCKAASEKLGANIKGGQKIQVTAIFPGEEGDTHAFLEEHKGLDFTSYLIDHDDLFLDLSGGTFPSMFLLDKDGKTVYHWTGDQLNYTGLDYLKSLEQ